MRLPGGHIGPAPGPWDPGTLGPLLSPSEMLLCSWASKRGPLGKVCPSSQDRGPGPLGTAEYHGPSCGPPGMEMTGQIATKPWALVCGVSSAQGPLRGGCEYVAMGVGPWSGVGAGIPAPHLAGGSSQPKCLPVLSSTGPGKRPRGSCEGHQCSELCFFQLGG